MSSHAPMGGTRRHSWRRGLAEQPLDEHAVAPLAVEPAVAALDADLVEPRRGVDRAARRVGREDARGQLVVAGALCGRAQLEQQRAPDAAAAGGGRDVDAVLADAAVDAAVGVLAHAREALDAGRSLGDHERQPVLEPRRDVGLRARVGLERGLALRDALVVDRGQRRYVGRSRGAQQRHSSSSNPALPHVPTPPSTTCQTSRAPSRWAMLAAVAARWPEAQITASGASASIPSGSSSRSWYGTCTAPGMWPESHSERSRTSSTWTAPPGRQCSCSSGTLTRRVVMPPCR